MSVLHDVALLVCSLSRGRERAGARGYASVHTRPIALTPGPSPARGRGEKSPWR